MDSVGFNAVSFLDRVFKTYFTRDKDSVCNWYFLKTVYFFQPEAFILVKGLHYGKDATVPHYTFRIFVDSCYAVTYHMYVEDNRAIYITNDDKPGFPTIVDFRIKN